MKNLKVLELFGGIGACSKALERLNIEHEVVDYVEIDKYAVKSYNAIHNTNFEPQDITQWDKDIEVDLIMHGSPCQDFSLAGKQAGGDLGSGIRSSLLYETVRIVEKLKPKYVIWENVKNVLSQKHRHNFDNYLKEMEKLGYTNYYQVLNAKDYGIPQNRERVFTISIRKDIDKTFIFPKGTLETTLTFLYGIEDVTCYKLNFICKTIDYIQDMFLYNENDIINPLKNISGKSWQFEQNVYSKDSILRSLKAGGGSGNIPKVIENFEFPPKQDLKLRLKDMLEDEVDEKYYLSDEKISKIANWKAYQKHSGMITYSDKLEETTNLQNELIGLFDDTSSDNFAKGKRDYGYRNEYGTLKCNPKYSIYKNTDLRIRKLTPKECFRLMGFDDADFEKASQVNSNAQLYKQAGNSIVVNVLEAIFKELLKGEDK